MTYHAVEAVALVKGCGQLSPDVEPFPGVLVDFLVPDFYTDILDECVSDVIDPEVCGIVRVWLWERREVDFNKETRQEVGFAGNEGTDATAEVGDTVEFNGYGLDCEGCVATIDLLEEGLLGIGCEVGILASSRDQLEKC